MENLMDCATRLALCTAHPPVIVHRAPSSHACVLDFTMAEVFNLYFTRKKITIEIQQQTLAHFRITTNYTQYDLVNHNYGDLKKGKVPKSKASDVWAI
jgi:hypothetical protein